MNTVCRVMASSPVEIHYAAISRLNADDAADHLAISRAKARGDLTTIIQARKRIVSRGTERARLLALVASVWGFAP